MRIFVVSFPKQLQFMLFRSLIKVSKASLSSQQLSVFSFHSISQISLTTNMYYSAYQQAQTHLITAKTLSELKAANTPNLVVLDVSIPMPGEKRDCYAEFKEKHIPGARFFSLSECREKETDNAYMLPSVKKFTECVQELGIQSYSKVVVYDANEKKGMFSSPRAWYMFRVFGHKDIYVLDGGLKKWIAEGNPTESGESPSVETSQYTGVEHNSNIVKSLEEIKDNISDKKFEVVDARSPGRFAGTAPEPRADIKPGCIPNSTNLFWTEFLEDGVFKSPEQLAEIYKSHGLDPKAAHVATCGSGVTACFIALSSYILGNYNVPVYDGAWTDWYQHAPADLKVNVPKE